MKYRPGEWAQITRAVLTRQCYNHLTAEDRRVYFGFIEGSLAWKDGGQELSVITDQVVDEYGMTLETTRPRTANDVAKKYGMKVQNVRRSLVALEQAGLSERRGLNGGPRRRFNVGVYCFSEPRTPTGEFAARARAANFDHLPPSWAPLIPELKRRRINIPRDLQIARELQTAAEEAARALQTLEDQLARIKELANPGTRADGPSLFEKEVSQEEEEKNSSSPDALSQGGSSSSANLSSPNEKKKTLPAIETLEGFDRTITDAFDDHQIPAPFDEVIAQAFNALPPGSRQAYLADLLKPRKQGVPRIKHMEHGGVLLTDVEKFVTKTWPRLKDPAAAAKGANEDKADEEWNERLRQARNFRRL